MHPESSLSHLASHGASVHAALLACVRRIPADELNWTPDEGIPSAAELIAAHVADELAAVGGERVAVAPLPGTRAAATLLKTVRAALTARLATGMDDAAVATALLATRLQADAQLLGGLMLMQRLIDPARALPHPG